MILVKKFPYSARYWSNIYTSLYISTRIRVQIVYLRLFYQALKCPWVSGTMLRTACFKPNTHTMNQSQANSHRVLVCSNPSTQSTKQINTKPKFEFTYCILISSDHKNTRRGSGPRSPPCSGSKTSISCHISSSAFCKNSLRYTTTPTPTNSYRDD